MSNVLNFSKFNPSPGSRKPGLDAEAVGAPALVCEPDGKIRSDIQHDLRSILLFLELAAFHLRQAHSMTSEPRLKANFDEYLASANKLIDLARQKALGL